MQKRDKRGSFNGKRILRAASVHLPVRPRRLEQLMHVNLPTATKLLRSSSPKTQRRLDLPTPEGRRLNPRRLRGFHGTLLLLGTFSSWQKSNCAANSRSERSRRAAHRRGAAASGKAECPTFCFFGQLHDYLTPWNQKPSPPPALCRRSRSPLPKSPQRQSRCIHFAGECPASLWRHG